MTPHEVNWLIAGASLMSGVYNLALKNYRWGLVNMLLGVANIIITFI